MSAEDSDGSEPPRRVTQIIWPAERVAKFWRAVRAGRAVILELVRREPRAHDGNRDRC